MKRQASDRMEEELAEEMLGSLATLISDHIATHVQSRFLQRTGIARNRIFRLRAFQPEPGKAPGSSKAPVGARTPGEIRFSMIELLRIAHELDFSTVSEMVAQLEREALERLRTDDPDARRRHRAIELAANFLRLSQDELDCIRQALDILHAPRPAA